MRNRRPFLIPGRGGGEAAQKRSHKKFETFFSPFVAPLFAILPLLGVADRWSFRVVT